MLKEIQKRILGIVGSIGLFFLFLMFLPLLSLVFGILVVKAYINKDNTPVGFYLGCKTAVYDSFVDYQLRHDWTIEDYKEEAWRWLNAGIPMPAWGDGTQYGQEYLEPSATVRYNMFH